MSVTVTGTEQVSRELDKRSNHAVNAITAILGAGAGLILAEARRQCTSARVRRALVAQPIDDGQGETIAIGPDLSKTKIAHFIEFGTSAHTQQSWNRKATIQHPGTSARPFLRPAFDSQKDKVEKEIGHGLSVAMELD
jgi:HK97 gp10 family phage protein